jgi:hypothetical protein
MGRPGIVYAISAAFLVAVLYPLSFGQREDSFPLSNYPMFARGRVDATLVADYAVAVFPDERRSIPPEVVANAEVLQAQATIRQAVRRGRAARQALCQEIVARVAADDRFAGATHVEIVRGRYDALAYFAGDRGRREHRWARCPVSRGGGS